MTRSWWGWGREDQHLGGEALRGLGEQVAARFGGDLTVHEPRGVDDLEVPEPRLRVPGALDGVCATDPSTRAIHAHGQAYRDVVSALHGELEAYPDVVATPGDESAVVAVLDWCADTGAACIPFGGGTSVVGGVNPPPDQPVVCLDTAALAGVAEIDATSGAALVRAGTTGPAVEDGLRPHGLTLRFYPQSWEFSTVGGWVATRAGGHHATLWTHIDDLVESVRAITPAGTWASRRLPASGAGPSPDRLLLGSEGILGLITQVWLRVRPRPTFRADASVEFRDFRDGCDAVRELARSDLHPANCRLLDPTEAALSGAGDGSASVLLLGFETADHPLDRWIDRALELCRDRGGVCEEGPRTRAGDRSGGKRGSAGAWRETFLRAPYLRDALVQLGMVVETFETAVTWDRLDDLVATVSARAREIAEEVCGAAEVSVRLTHAYPDGAAPYWTVIGPGRRGDEVAQWDAIKEAVADAILAAGGTITHHHAVGRDHREWYDRQRPEPFAAALAAAKSAVDPAGTMNPGVLVG